MSTKAEAELELGARSTVEVDLSSTAGDDADKNSLSKMPCTKIRMDFENITCEVQIKDKAGPKTKTILHGLSGTVEPGQLLAIMGSSGAGKSTLFNVLTFRLLNEQNGCKVSGSIKLNGEEATVETFRRHAAYVMQDDVLLPTSTPREALSFCANMRLPSTMSQEEKDDRVTQVLKELRILKCADSPIGSRRVKGISGGEKKRTAIGAELIANPSILFLDEPTSGLDSFTALKLISLLKQFARQGRTVVITIHQPSLEIFELFDKLILLSEGKIIYNGDANDSVRYFSSLGFNCPRTMNPADFLLRTMQEESDLNKVMFFDAYERSEMSRIEFFNPENPLDSELPMLSTMEENVSPIPVHKQFRLLCERSFQTFVRSKELLVVRAIELLVNALFLGTLYYQIDLSQSGITNRMGAIFNMMMVTFMGSVIACCAAFPDERPLFLREKANNMYKTWTYFFAKLVSEFPFQVLYPICFSLIFYWLVGLVVDVGHFFAFVLITFLLQNMGYAIGLFLGSAVSEADTARGLIPFAVIPFSLVCGLFIVASEIPTYLVWMRWISPFRFAYESYIILEFFNLSLYCDDDETVSGVCPVTDGTTVMASLGLDADDFWFDIGMMGVLYVLFISLSFLMLTIRKDKL